MLPFTKRPGRGAADDNGDVVVTKDNLPARAKTTPPQNQASAEAQPAKKAKTVPPPSSGRKARSIPPPGASDRPRLFQPSISDEEMTTLMPSKSAERERLMARGNKAPPPAAGRPASVPPAAAGGGGQMRGKALSVDDEGDEGRTQIRAPLAGRMLVPNSKIHSTDENDEDERTVGLVQNPMLASDAHPADAPEPTRAMAGAPANSPHAGGQGIRPAAGEPSVEVAFQTSPPPPAQSHPLMLQQQGHQHGMQQTHGMQPQQQMMRPQQQPQMAYAPTMHAGSHQQQPMVAHLSGAYPQQHGMPAPAMSQPAHFAVPQMASSEQRMDPPATVLTQSNSRGSRTMSWAAALMAVGVFVGLVAAVVAGGGSDGLADTSASFVDPSRPNKRAAAQPDPNAAPAAQPVMPTTGVPQGGVAQQAGGQQPQPFAQVTPPPGPASPNGQSVFPQVGTQPPAQPAQPGMNPPDPTAVGMGNPIANSGVNTGTSTTPAAPAPQPQPAQPQPAAQPAPVAVAAADPPKPRSAPRAAAPRPAPQPAAAANNDDDPPKPVAAAAPKPPKPAAASKPAAKGGGDDDELKKAADALSKAQLENSL